MRKILAVCLIILLLLGICWRYTKVPTMTETDLEFWIAERVSNTDFANHSPKFGLMGGSEYYGLGYEPTLDENGEQHDPEQCVIYTVTSYPDYVANKQHVTRIVITDPAVQVYGLTMDSNIEEIESKMKKEGFRIEYSARGLTATKGKYTFQFSEDFIRIHVKVSNIFRIQF